jgi:CRP/FNR family transcriptional regulator, nitrogen fixation regulation protein
MLTGTATQIGSSRRHWIDQTKGKARPVGSRGLADAIEVMGVRKWFNHNAEIYMEKEPADYFYKVVSGTVRTYKVVVDGRRQIGAFYLPGDIFGLEAGAQHLLSAEAIVDAEVLAIKRNVLISLAARDNAVARELWMLTASELQRTQKHMLLLSKTAPERVASFLLEMAERVQSSDEIQLSMSRQDVADYLGLTSETISRMLTRFEKSAAIALPTCKRIVLRDRPVLKQLLA